jgi:hypothetical protein
MFDLKVHFGHDICSERRSAAMPLTDVGADDGGAMFISIALRPDKSAKGQGEIRFARL